MTDEPKKPHHPLYPLMPPDDDVGYGKPPVASRFQPGQSGNPKGRSKGNKSFAGILGKVLYEKVPLTQNGQMKDMLAIEGILKATRSRAFKGDVRAAKLLLDLGEKHKVEQRNEPAREIHIHFVKPDPDLVAQAEKEGDESDGDLDK
jgi:Family of unknown function (DUF5681)